LSSASVTADLPESERPPRLAVVLFNLGGPDSPEAIRPFLLNLFRDPAILRVPPFVRPFLARLIAKRRIAPATANYALLGGRSPLLGLTQTQAEALRTALQALLPQHAVRCFIAMRYWHPFARETVRAVRDFAPDRILLLPLYPQFSTTTTGSSLTDWHEAAAAAGLAVEVTTLCCWPSDAGFVAAQAALLRATLAQAEAALPQGGKLRILFSAHGLPEVIVCRGDPYQAQVEQTVAAVIGALNRPELEHRVCYQSRATPQKWLDPSTDAEIAAAGQDGIALIVVPIAFVSDHSETLVELDIEYRHLAERAGVPFYWRVPAPNDDPGFIAALAGIACHALARGPGLTSERGSRVCPISFGNCPHR
jgi:protoporphyrin/coproporphyrin ferrochelatase